MTNKNTENSNAHQASDREFRYCPKCTEELRNRLVDHQTRQACIACNFILYQNPKAVAVALVQKSGKILLIRRGNRPKHGYWSFPTGFIDIGETPAETAIRETKEEANVEIKLERLLGVYSDKQRAVILIVHVGTIVSGVPTGSAEALDARLFHPKSLPNLAFEHDYHI